MMVDSSTIYKLMILYMLKKVNFPLSNPQMWTFFEQKGYTTYFTFQQVIGQLKDANLLSEESVRNMVLYEITPQGEDALYYFSNDISTPIKDEIDAYLSENRFQMRNETGITADYHRTEDRDYIVHTKVREGKTTLFEMNINVPTEEQAKVLCEHFEENAQTIYAYVMKHLM